MSPYAFSRADEPGLASVIAVGSPSPPSGSSSRTLRALAARSERTTCVPPISATSISPRSIARATWFRRTSGVSPPIFVTSSRRGFAPSRSARRRTGFFAGQASASTSPIVSIASMPAPARPASASAARAAASRRASGSLAPSSGSAPTPGSPGRTVRCPTPIRTADRPPLMGPPEREASLAEGRGPARQARRAARRTRPRRGARSRPRAPCRGGVRCGALRCGARVATSQPKPQREDHRRHEHAQRGREARSARAEGDRVELDRGGCGEDGGGRRRRAASPGPARGRPARATGARPARAVGKREPERSRGLQRS